MGNTSLSKPSVLIIEDEATQRHLLQRQLEQQGFCVHAAATGLDGMQLCAEQPEIRIVITDLALPELDGVGVVQAIRSQEKQHTYLMVLTAIDNKQLLIRALAAGADDFVGKPILQEELALRMQGALSLLRLEDQYRLVGVMAELAAMRRGELGLNRQLVEDIGNASVLHDIGTMNIPDQLLKKRRKLTAKEYEIIKEHAAFGGKVLKGLYHQTGSPYLLLAHELAISHHERWDGDGYPNGLRKEEIPLAGRIVALADTYDALRSRKPYKDPMPAEFAEEVIASASGTHFDPMLVESFLRIKDTLARHHDRLRDGDETW